jgi:hypothetical protein
MIWSFSLKTTLAESRRIYSHCQCFHRENLIKERFGVGGTFCLAKNEIDSINQRISFARDLTESTNEKRSLFEVAAVKSKSTSFFGYVHRARRGRLHADSSQCRDIFKAVTTKARHYQITLKLNKLFKLFSFDCESFMYHPS